MDKALAGIPGTFPCADDVRVQRSTEEHHDLYLFETIESAQKAGIKFNQDKCLKQARIIYIIKVKGCILDRGKLLDYVFFKIFLVSH